MASIPSKHARGDNDAFRPNKLLRGSREDGQSRESAILLDDSDNDNDSDLTLLDTKLPIKVRHAVVCNSLPPHVERRFLPSVRS